MQFVLVNILHIFSCSIFISDKEVKNLWKNLRDEFRKQYNKTPRSGDAAPEPTTWKYFNSMLFLTDQFVPRKSTGNLTAEQAVREDVSMQQEEDTLMESFLEDEMEDSPSVISHDNAQSSRAGVTSPVTTPQPSPTQTTTSRTGFKSRLTAQAKIGQELINLEREKLKLKQNRKEDDKNDEDVAFFNSLLPTVKSLDQRKKMLFRMKVQQTLFEMAFPPEAETTRHHFQPEPYLHRETSSSVTSNEPDQHYSFLMTQL